MDFEFYPKYIKLADFFGYTGAEKAKWVEHKVSEAQAEKKAADAIEREDKKKSDAIKRKERESEREFAIEKEVAKARAELEKFKMEAVREIDLARAKLEDKEKQRQHELELEKSKSNQSQVLFANRETKHESTGFSPFELELINKQEEKFDPHELVNQTRERILDGVQTAQENAQLASERHRNIKNKHRYSRTFERRDLDFVKLPDRENIEASQGPFEVIKKLSDVNDEINIKGNKTPIHIDRMKKLYVEPEKLIEDEHMACTIMSESCNTQEIKTYHIPVKEKNIMDKMINEYNDMITTEMGFTETIQHKIELIDYSAMKGKHYQVPVAYREAVEAEMDLLLESGQIERTESAYSSPMVIVRKKNKVRICCDYQELNKRTKIDAESRNDPKNILETINKSSIFTTCDMNRSFWQIGLKKESRQYTAFTSGKGLCQWKVMSFRLVNSTATFQKFMNKMTEGMTNLIFFVDDICIHNNTWAEHVETLKELLERLRKHVFTIAPEKLHVGVDTIEFLGFKVGNKEIRPTEGNKDKILNIKTPSTKKEVKSLFGLCNFYNILWINMLNLLLLYRFYFQALIYNISYHAYRT